MEFLDYLFLGTLGIILTFGIFGGFTANGVEVEKDEDCPYGEDDEDCTCGTNYVQKEYIVWKRVFVALMILGFEIWLLALAHAPYNQY